MNTAFELFNKVTYPRFVALLDELGRPYDQTEFSYTFRCAGSREDPAWQLLLPTLLSPRNAVQLADASFRGFARLASRVGNEAKEFVADPDPELTFGEFLQPVLTPEVLRLRQKLAGLQGLRRAWFCGVYACGLGFHESGVESAMLVAEAIRARGVLSLPRAGMPSA